MGKLYKILWADDQIDALYERDKYVKKDFADNGVCVAKTYRYMKALCNDVMDKTFMRNVDAIVVDANMPAEDNEVKGERDVSGHFVLSQKLEYITQTENTPIILYTGKRNVTVTNEYQLLFSYFIDNKQVVDKKDGLYPLFDKIKEVVDRQNSPEWVVGNQYKKELDIFHKFDRISGSSSEKLIKDLLVRNYTNSFGDEDANELATCLNRIRSEIFEPLNYTFANVGIVPSNISINDFSYLMCGTSNLYQWKEKVFPEALTEMMRSTIYMIQDGSHKFGNGKGSLKLEIYKYIESNRDTFIIRSVLYSTIELICWAVNYYEANQNYDENIKRWEEIGDLAKYENKECVLEMTDGILHYDKCMICQPKENKDCFIGCKVRLYDVKKNKNKEYEKLYPYFAKYTKIDKQECIMKK